MNLTLTNWAVSQNKNWTLIENGNQCYWEFLDLTVVAIHLLVTITNSSMSAVDYNL